MSFDGFCPLGPAIVTADEVADPQGLRVELDVNGTERQRFGTERHRRRLAARSDQCNDPGRRRGRQRERFSVAKYQRNKIPSVRLPGPIV